MKNQPKTVAFQLDAKRTRRLEQFGKKYKMSAGQYARELVIRSLDTDQEDLLEALNLLASKMDETDKDIQNLREVFSNDLQEIVKVLQVLVDRKN